MASGKKKEEENISFFFLGVAFFLFIMPVPFFVYLGC
jgi:hypothetical protein